MGHSGPARGGHGGTRRMAAEDEIPVLLRLQHLYGAGVYGQTVRREQTFRPVGSARFQAHLLK